MWYVILIPFVVRNGEYGNSVGLPNVWLFWLLFHYEGGHINSFPLIEECMLNRSKYFFSKEW